MIKILAIDDQQLILLSLQKHLTDIGFDVLCATTGKEGLSLFDSYKPDITIVDINLDDMSGLDVVKTIRQEKNSKTKILVLSGDTKENTIFDGFELGIDDYMKKPVSLNEVAVRISRMFGLKIDKMINNPVKDQMLQKRCVGVVIPCYNEEKRLLSKDFINFVDSNLGYHLCFVNDGSKDNTLGILNSLKEGREANISVYNCEKNGGKGEAVRQGVLHLIKDKQLDYIGYLDADLSTDFRDFDDLVKTLETSDFKIISGSRMSRMGADITKESARKIISKSINLIIRTILGMPFNDTQCGAKIMRKEIVNNIFQEKFLTRWLFDVEIFIRIRKHYGKKKALSYICEQPLKRWIHADGSKLSIKDSMKIIGQLGQIAIHYR